MSKEQIVKVSDTTMLSKVEKAGFKKNKINVSLLGAERWI